MHIDSSKRSWLVVFFGLAFPSLVTWMYFVVFAEQTARSQQLAYGVGKVIQFAFPLLWVFAWQRRKWQRPDSLWRGVPTGLVFGMVVAALMTCLYQWLQDGRWFEPATAAIREKVAATGFASRLGYIGLGVFYTVCHSLLEEYYWRWFVYGELKRLTSWRAAAAISSLGFMAHHVILLASYFGWDSPLTWIFSLAIAVGGAVWAWLYEWSGSLLAPWLSHAIVDAAIFGIGYDVVRELLS